MIPPVFRKLHLLLRNDLVKQNEELREMFTVSGRQKSFSLRLNSIILNGISINLVVQVKYCSFLYLGVG